MSNQRLVISPYEQAEPVLIRAVTNLHPGVGRTGEIVDLPVQKDNLGYPIIYSSSLKGALKSAVWHYDSNLARVLFGPDPEEGEKFTSAMAVTDGFIVAFPVRSLEGIYAFATSPLLLKRFSELLKIVGNTCKCVEELSNKQIGKGICLTSNKAKDFFRIEGFNNRIIINEEIIVESETDQSKNIEDLEKLFGIEQGRLILLNDDDALRALERSLVRVTRIAVDRKTKRVKEGALWTEEYIPRDTIYATVFLYSKARNYEKISEKEDNLKDKFKGLLNIMRNYLIIGGNETIGRGIVKLDFIKLELNEKEV